MPNHNPPSPPKLETVEQLKEKLNRQKNIHNGHGFDRLVEMWNSPLNYTKTQIALEFNVTWPTAHNWVLILEAGAEK